MQRISLEVELVGRLIGRVIVLNAQGAGKNEFSLELKQEARKIFDELKQSSLIPAQKLICVFPNNKLNTDTTLTAAIALCNDPQLSTDFMEFIHEQVKACSKKEIADLNLVKKLGDIFYDYLVPLASNEKLVLAYIETIKTILLLADADKLDKSLLTHTSEEDPAKIGLTLGMKIAIFQPPSVLRTYGELLEQLYKQNKLPLNDHLKILKQKNNNDTEIADFVACNNRKPVYDDMLQAVKKRIEIEELKEDKKAFAPEKVQEALKYTNTWEPLFTRLIKSKLSAREKYYILTMKGADQDYASNLMMFVACYGSAEQVNQCFKLLNSLLADGVSTEEVANLLKILNKKQGSFSHYIANKQKRGEVQAFLSLLEKLLSLNVPLSCMTDLLKQKTGDYTLCDSIATSQDAEAFQDFLDFLLRLHTQHQLPIKEVRALAHTAKEKHKVLKQQFNCLLDVMETEESIKKTFSELLIENKYDAQQIPVILSEISETQRKLLENQIALLQIKRDQLKNPRSEEYSTYSRLLGYYNQILKFPYVPISFAEHPSDKDHPEMEVFANYMQHQKLIGDYEDALCKPLLDLKTEIAERKWQIKGWKWKGVWGWKEGLPKKISKIQAILLANTKPVLEQYAEILKILATRNDKKNKSNSRHPETETFYRETETSLKSIMFKQSSDIPVFVAQINQDVEEIHVKTNKHAARIQEILSRKADAVVHQAQFDGDRPQVLPVGVAPEERVNPFEAKPTYTVLFDQWKVAPAPIEFSAQSAIPSQQAVIVNAYVAPKSMPDFDSEKRTQANSVFTYQAPPNVMDMDMDKDKDANQKLFWSLYPEEKRRAQEQDHSAQVQASRVEPKVGQKQKPQQRQMVLA